MTKTIPFIPQPKKEMIAPDGIPIEMIRKFEEKEAYYIKGIHYSQNPDGSPRLQIFQSVATTEEELMKNIPNMARFNIFPIGSPEKNETQYRFEWDESQEKALEEFERAELKRLKEKYNDL